MNDISPIPDGIENNLEHLAHLNEKAAEVAVRAHRHQRRPLIRPGELREPYIVHPKRVGDKLPPYLKALGLLHDVIEDNPQEYPEEVMRQIFPPWIVDRLMLLSKQPGEEYDEFILRIKQDVHAARVKIEDLRDNSRDLKPGSRRDKYRLALRLLGVEP